MHGKFRVVPEFMPEELARSYAGRLARWNGISERNELRRAASEALEGSQPTSVKEVIWLAGLVGQDPARFVRDHTLVPFTQSLTNGRRSGGNHGSESSLESLSCALRVGRRNVQFCPCCLAEDRSFHGFSYWRREPQLPGRIWCSKHLCALARVENVDIFSAPPGRVAAGAVRHDTAWVEQLKKLTIVSRFFAIQEGLLAQKASLQQAPVSRMIRDRALERGFHGGAAEVKGQLLSQHLLENVDHKWLCELFPDLTDAPAGEYLWAIDSATRGHHDACSPSGYVVAAAVLWDDADEALNALLNAKRLDNPRQFRSRDQPLAERYDLPRAYADAKGNHLRVARDLGLPKASVASSLKKLGLPALGEQPDSRLINAIRSFGQGKSLEAAATSNQIEVQILEDVVRRSIDRFSIAIAAWPGAHEQIVRATAI